MPFDLSQLVLQNDAPPPLIRCRTLALLLVGSSELPRQLRCLKVLLEPGKDRSLDLVHAEDAVVAAGTRFVAHVLQWTRTRP
ncbi:hypothetical protein [Rhodovulum sp.]|uniref:hypothetical protein n=1 Tax=Rhodovulum sp. TaxID=34009 RepID=UPI002579471E|nr:hypothetical protein [Rhodovulum sp.]